MGYSKNYGTSPTVRRAAVLLALTVVAAIITLCVAMADRPTVRDRVDLAEVSYGIPLDWLHQDGSSLDPSFPYRSELEDPRDFPTRFAAWPFLADTGVVLAAELVLLGLWTQLARRNRPGR